MDSTSSGSSEGATSGGTATAGPGTDSASTSTATGGGTTGGGETFEPCPPFEPPAGPVVDVSPEMADELPGLVASAAPGTVFAFAPGTYDLSGANLLHVTTPGLVFYGTGDDPEAVVLDAGYGIGEIFLVEAPNTTIANLTAQRAFYHPIHVTGGTDGNTTGTRIYRVRVVDPGQQGIKINASSAGYFSDEGEIACSEIRMTDAGRGFVTDCYTGGIDAHSAWGWTVRDNYIEGFWCDQGLSEHGVHFWVTSRDTVVERNVIVDCARGIGFGLGAMGNGKTRVYPDDPCPGAGYLGHIDGIVRNNVIVGKRPELFASASGMDSGVALEQACGPIVVHNTVVALEPPFVSMEYRFENTSAVIRNNLVTHDIVARDGGQATLSGNVEQAPLSEFVDPASGDVHLVAGAAAVDAGDVLAGEEAVERDIDGDPRDALPDPGADEFVPGP
ncbi:MAG: hypothetical protein D6705_03490 [Deltaproteobacteria bacterium]|nr:MAG: hypothetical protein D6705_03490 [Deltaproteobacteria bacterium]